DRMLAITSARDVAIYDDALLWNRENRFYPLCEHIRESHPGISLHTPNGLHVSCLDERCCQEMFSTGFRTIRLSYEGTDRLTAAASSGKVGEGDYERAVRNLTRAGYSTGEIETYVLAGLPGQSTHDVERSIDFVKSLGCRPKLTEYSPIPGTRAYASAAERNPDVISDPLLHNNTIYAQYVAGSPTPEELQALKDRTRL
ncbi:MAG: B12-binding domain-containing radical SAM protein, partial [Synergistaceae bacterium]|nr:B12-binding domain-containing radical SAM protein [Synergistaceae bacterium]